MILWLYSCSTPKAQRGPECTKNSKWQDQPITILLCNFPSEASSSHPRFWLCLRSALILYSWMALYQPTVKTASRLIRVLPTLAQALAFVPCLSCVVGMSCPGLCLVGPAWSWLSNLILGLSYHYKLAWWSLECGWPWYLSLDLLCSCCPDTVGLYPLSVRSLPTLLSPWLLAHIFLQSSSLLLLHPQLHCGF